MEILTANDLNPTGAYALRLTNQGSSSTPAFTETGLAFNVALGGTGANPNFYAARIYAKYDSFNVYDGRLTLQTRNGLGNLVDTLNVKGGNVGIGTISPQYPLHAVTPSGIVARFQNGNNSYCDINPTATALVCTSDERLKKNIKPMGDGLTQIMALRPVHFNWNAESTDTPGHPGFIAQQVQQVIPEVVSTDPTTGLLSIGYSDLVPAVVSAMHQMETEITTLHEQNRSLEARLIALETLLSSKVLTARK
jgi:Chaperone of endosialidase